MVAEKRDVYVCERAVMTCWKLDVTWRCHRSVFPAAGYRDETQTNQLETNEKNRLLRPDGAVAWGRGRDRWMARYELMMKGSTTERRQRRSFVIITVGGDGDELLSMMAMKPVTEQGSDRGVASWRANKRSTG